MSIYTTKAFEKSLKRIARKNHLLLAEVKTALELLYENDNHPRLKKHKLESRKNQDWSISVNHKIRIIFFRRKNDIILTNIGSHDEVY